MAEHFTLIYEDKDVLGKNTGAKLLGCALPLKYFQSEP